MARRALTLIELYKETLIPNTTCLKEILKKYLYLHERKGRELSILLVDVDNLRKINREKGYFWGNTVLISVADIISKSVRKSDVAGKYKSGSFLILLPETDSSGAAVVVERLKKKLEGLQVDGIPVTVTIGSVTYPHDGEWVEDLLTHLEIKVTELKGKPVLHLTNRKGEEITLAFLQRAIEEDRVLPVFQPILSLKENKIFGYEVLMRIEGENGRLIPASMFIEKAQDTSRMSVLDEIVWRKAFQAWKRKGVQGYLFVNFPSYLTTSVAKGLARLEEFANELRTAGIEPQRVCIEIPESKVLGTTEQLVEFLQVVKNMGFKVAVDDFGVEHSSVERLLKTKPHIVKVDGFFLREERRILRWVIAGLHRLGYRVVLEGVEKEEDLALAKRLGVEFVQGFYIGIPEVWV
ncbi:diguanylate cyclase/phosphodiesterase [Thermocrinis albus DSM 14484]|uniref:Diguanylate cyclase/phosphodiesterase n=1 Tax=Thermocrinis albus (strain DSM 14484 / JCM 11386 / HI 11/12) TaxID=638303 RepID=D3SLH4_THEAH|nr:bifunctional diguanylate cyclase/phosphodiesterase [Thermocrinis albus]ADC89604.1 diguanylate cyclase/phosphodiesterase [Thermocrinis albus DSM 14484]